MPELIPVLEKEKIDTVAADIVGTISRDYQSKELIPSDVLKGSFHFLADLMRHLTIQLKVDFMGAPRYGFGISSSEKYRNLPENDYMKFLTGAR